ncbi:hypothetical protein AX17_000995 [Amanita inopinata Kibby_2008]|nr:hypothetical protein AX17_000995 [Amanita inopinata Kibby_2008]
MPSLAGFNSNLLPPATQPGQKKYYNRPKFLQAPDASTLASPSFGTVKERTPVPLPPIMELLGLKQRSETAPLDVLNGSAGATRYQPTICAVLPHGRLVNASMFPPPPTLEDIKRMEPDMSPESIMKRVGTIGGHLNNTRSSSTRTVVMQSQLSAPYPAVDPYSPIARPVKRTRTTSNGLGLAPQDLMQYEGRLKSKRLRVSVWTHGTTEVSNWWTNFLITALTKTQFRDMYTTNEAVLKKLQRNIRMLVKAFELSNSMVILAFWYIYRLFPDGFMHPEMFSTREGGMIAWRVFLIGNMLAQKWLEDTSYKATCWQPLFELPLKSVKAIERTTLGLLDYNLLITNCEWQRWLEHLHSVAELDAAYSPAIQCSVSEMLYDLSEQARHASADEERLRFIRTSEANSYELVLQLIDPSTLEDSFEFVQTPLLLRIRAYSTVWNPAADPIITAKPRACGIAPIARPTNRSKHSFEFPPDSNITTSSYRCHSTLAPSTTSHGSYIDGHYVPAMT